MSDYYNIWADYPPQRQIRKRLREVRHNFEMLSKDAAAIVSEETGYAFTAAQWEAIETGVTKNVPLWAVLAFVARLQINPMEVFDL